MSAEASIRRRRYLVLLGSVLGIGIGLWFANVERNPRDPDVRPDPHPPDPRLAFETPYRNVRPDVAYVGDAACTGCHAAIAAKYRQHPMGRSAEWVGRGPAADAHVRGANNPATSGQYELGVHRRGDDRVEHVVAVPGLAARYAVTADLAIGSGRQGKSYLTVDGPAVWQSPISWFRQGNRWDVSPGFELGATSRRAVAAGCLECHTDVSPAVSGSVNRFAEPLIPFQTSIGCERCHGPGAVHVAERSNLQALAGADDSIVHPARLSNDLQSDICRQCHLQGEVRLDRRGRRSSDYRPGLPFEQFVAVFVTPPDRADAKKSVGQFEQMEQSRCLTASGGRMTCTTCHDPHGVPADPIAHYRDRCLTCHGERGCSAPAETRRAKRENCIECHMPARDSSNIAHAAVTDHRIPRRPGAAVRPTRAVPADPFPLVPYRAGPHAPPEDERERDAAVAFGREVARTRAINPASADLLPRVHAKLDASLRRWPGDEAAWSAAAGFELARGNSVRAMEAARRAVALAPESETATLRLAEVASEIDDFPTLADAAERLVQFNPSSADHRVALATARIGMKQWDRAEDAARAALAIHPLHPNARVQLGVCLDRRGNPRAGRTELELGLRLTPTAPQRANLSDWYLRQIR